MTGCYVYGSRAGDTHLWETKHRGPWQHGKGPLCIRCGLPRGTFEFDEASDYHNAAVGHRLGTGACDDAGCDERVVILAWRSQ